MRQLRGPLMADRRCGDSKKQTMLLKSEWAERFIKVCAKVPSVRRDSLTAGQSVYLGMPEGRCWVVAAGYVKLLDPRADGNRFVRLMMGFGGLFGDRRKWPKDCARRRRTQS